MGRERARREPSRVALPKAERGSTLEAMAVVPKKLKIGDLVEVDGRRYDVVSDKAGGVTLEPAITVFAEELHQRRGTRPPTDQEFDELFGDLPSDGEG